MSDMTQESLTQTKLFFALAAVLVVSLAWFRFHQRNGFSSNKAQNSALDAKRPFVTPKPDALDDFDLASKEPIKYRPFRHGPNQITMGIRKLDWNEWIQLDCNYMRYHDIKASELKKDLHGHVKYVDNAVTRDACFELLEEPAAYLSNRYPSMFQLDGSTLKNTLTGEVFDYPARTPTDALATAALLVQDDLVLMIKNDDEHYRFDAGAICLPGFWRLREKFRTSLDELHENAKVPHYERKLKTGMNRFFARLAPESPVTRNNYFIQLDDGLHWSHRMGDQGGVEEASWAAANSEGLSIEEIHFRSERQTLRRLPRSRALVFTVRTYFEPITTIAKELHVPGRLAEAIRSWDDTVAEYKGKKHWDHILLPYLDEQHKIQQESGLLVSQPEAEFPY